MCAGPDVFARARAAQQLAWAVRRLGYRALGGVVNYGLPVVLAAASDPSPAVQRQGLRTLQHIATGVYTFLLLLWPLEAFASTVGAGACQASLST